MGLFDLFRKDEVTGAKVLVCSLDPRFNPVMDADARVYKRFYPATTSKSLNGVADLTSSISNGYDVVHLLADVTPEGAVTDAQGQKLAGKDLLQSCVTADVKVLWIASDNKAENYNKGFGRGQKINLALNLDRMGPYFNLFMTDLFTRLAAGEAMSSAWDALCNPGSKNVQPDVPESIFHGGRGGLRLR